MASSVLFPTVILITRFKMASQNSQTTGIFTSGLVGVKVTRMWISSIIFWRPGDRAPSHCLKKTQRSEMLSFDAPSIIASTSFETAASHIALKYPNDSQRLDLTVSLIILSNSGSLVSSRMREMTLIHSLHVVGSVFGAAKREWKNSYPFAAGLLIHE